jgi:hypothetical protein
MMKEITMPDTMDRSQIIRAAEDLWARFYEAERRAGEDLAKGLLGNTLQADLRRIIRIKRRLSELQFFLEEVAKLPYESDVVALYAALMAPRDWRLDDLLVDKELRDVIARMATSNDVIGQMADENAPIAALEQAAWRGLTLSLGTGGANGETGSSLMIVADDWARVNAIAPWRRPLFVEVKDLAQFESIFGVPWFGSP